MTLIEESKNLWKLEKESLSEDATDIEKELYELLDKLINSGTIMYQDFIDTVINKCASIVDSDDADKRKEQVNAMHAEVLKHFKNINNEQRSKEIR